MGIKALLIETTIVLVSLIIMVVFVNNIQTHHNASKFLNKLQMQRLNSTYEIYKDQLIGDLLLDNRSIKKTLVNEISKTRNLGVVLKFNNQKISAGKISHDKPHKSYSVQLGGDKEAKLSLFAEKKYKYSTSFHELWLSVIVEALILILGFIYLWWRFNKRLLLPLREQFDYIREGKIKEYKPNNKMVYELQELSQTIKEMHDKIQEKATYEAEVNAAKQVAHDIKSPLASLNFLLDHVSSLPEKQRTLMRSSIQRITDIANTLYSKSRQNYYSEDGKVRKIMVPSVLESVLSEKRVQLKNKNNIKIIVSSFEKVYGAFIKIDPIAFKRVLSNLVNNSIEACIKENHYIEASIYMSSQIIEISIKDDGKGIPNSILSKVWAKGFTYDKNSLNTAGSGLGLYYAKDIIEAHSGNLSIDSTEGKGTAVTISLPRCKPPSWFVNKLYLNNIKKIVVLDDDKSIHRLWKERFDNHSINAELVHFTHERDFVEYFSQEEQSKILYLIDYELVNQNNTGLDLIAKFGITEKAILITSYYEDKEVRRQADNLGLKIIPKDMAAFVPIEI